MSMELHKDKDAFQALLSAISEKAGIREDIIEKDYYLTLLLSELASWQAELPAYFKGGTALYKAIGSLQRFSEDMRLRYRTARNLRAKRDWKRRQTVIPLCQGQAIKPERLMRKGALPAFTNISR